MTQTSFFKSCLRLAKLFKLNHLIDELDKKFLTLHESQNTQHPTTSSNLLTKFSQLTVKDVEIFSKIKLTNTIN